jgi:pyruvate dehydrogenase phosphatase
MLTRSFVELDEKIVAAPLALLDTNDSVGCKFALTHLLPLDKAGARVSTVMLDFPRQMLYAASLGDCRAVAGWLDPATGRWRCDVLSDVGDMTYDNPGEETM